MTYYEWVEFLDSIKTSPRDNKIIEKLQGGTLALDGNVLYRFINHINDLIRYRLSTTLEKTLKNISSNSNINSFNLEIIDIKKELHFCLQITKIPFLPIENKQNFVTSINHFANEINDALLISIKDSDKTGEIAAMIRNSKINVLEEI